MPDLGKWMSPDPLAEEYSSWSPYNFVMNSPLRFIDPTGMFIEPPSQPGETEGEIYFDEDTGASYVWDGEGGWHSNMQGVEELDEVVITNEDSSGNDNEYSQVVTNIEYIGGGGAIEYIGGGGIIKGVSLLRNARLAGRIKSLFGSSKAAKGVANLIPEGKLANHLFKGTGKLADNSANRTLIQKIANGKPLVVDKFGKSWYRGVDASGKGIYSYTQNGIVKGAGYTNFNEEKLINHIITTVGIK